jgi:hypothetical protein
LLYNKALLRWQVIGWRRRGAKRQSTASREEYDQALARGAEDFEHGLRGFLALARASGIPVVVPEVVYEGVPTPDARDSARVNAVWRVATPYAPPAVVYAGYAKMESVTRAAAAEYGDSYVPTEGFDLSDSSWYAEGDPVHFNDRGSDRWAQSLANVLLKLAPWKKSLPPRKR